MDTGSGRIVPAEAPGAVRVPDHLAEAAQAVDKLGVPMWHPSHPYEELRQWAMTARAARPDGEVPTIHIPHMQVVDGAAKAQPGAAMTITTTRGPDGKPVFLINGKPANHNQLRALGIRVPKPKAYVERCEQQKRDKERRRKLAKQRRR